MKVKLKVYKCYGTLKRDFSSVEQAQVIAGLMGEKYPEIHFEPHIELSTGSVIDLSELEKNDSEPGGAWEEFHFPLHQVSQ